MKKEPATQKERQTAATFVESLQGKSLQDLSDLWNISPVYLSLAKSRIVNCPTWAIRRILNAKKQADEEQCPTCHRRNSDIVQEEKPSNKSLEVGGGSAGENLTLPPLDKI